MPFQFNPFTDKLDLVETGGGGGGVTTIDGDSGSITGSTVTIYAHQSSNNSGSSVSFSNSGTTSTLNLSDGSSNTFLGTGSGTVPQSGVFNTCIGAGSGAGISGNSNVAVGHVTLNSATSGHDNVAIGNGSQLGATGSQNVAVGSGTMQNATPSGVNNVVIGHTAGFDMTGSGANNVIIGALAYTGAFASGNSNVIVGQNSGINYTSTESNNILVGQNVVGTVGESNTTRIGPGGTVTACFIDGISGKTVTGTAVLCSTSGQLGTISSSERYKENIRDIPVDVSILDLKTHAFNYKKDLEKSTQYGLIAEEVHKDFPYLCFYDDMGQPESVKYHELPVLLLKEIQRLTDRVSVLEDKINKLASQGC